MTTEGGRRRYLPARDQIMISRARREAAGGRGHRKRQSDSQVTYLLVNTLRLGKREGG